MQEYKKVVKRLAVNKIFPVVITNKQKQEECKNLKDIAGIYGVKLEGCCTKESEISRCIDGQLFNRLHPDGYNCSVRKAEGQRELCGCTESWDIGWYYPCPNGCLYCYANPKISRK